MSPSGLGKALSGNFIPIIIISLFKRTTWNKNPYTLGSYSYIDLTGSALKHITNLAEPIYMNGKVPKTRHPLHWGASVV